MTSIFSTVVGSSKRALVFISLIVVITVVDSQFINLFYGTNLETPGNYHLLLFISLVIIVSIINIILILFAKRNDIHATTSRRRMLLLLCSLVKEAAEKCNIDIHADKA
jgi:uncharacterized membrane protein